MTASNTYPASWYPLCRTRDVPRNSLKQINAFDAQLIVFRNASNTVGAMAARCPHMGASLARGRIVGDCVQCPLHHWQFGADGRCTHIPNVSSATHPIPKNAAVRALHCEEHYGLVWAFLGDAPSFEFPLMRDADRWFTRAFILDFDTPYQVFTSNSFDVQHFVTVHHRELLEPPVAVNESPHHIGLKFRAKVLGAEWHDRLLRTIGVRTVELEGHCWGSSILFGYNARTHMRTLLAVLPEKVQRTRVFVVSALAKHTAPKLPQPIRRVMLGIAHGFTLAFLKNDIAVARDLQFKPGTLLPDLDQHYIAWVQYWQKLPRVDSFS